MKRVCAVDGCGREHDARGYCRKHYARWYRHGDPLVGGRLEDDGSLVCECGRRCDFDGLECRRCHRRPLFAIEKHRASR